MSSLSSETPLPRLPAREPDSHKGDYGRAMLVGGSRGMSGAIALAGMAALRGGAGLVKLAVPDVCLETVAAHEPSYITVPLPADELGQISAAARPALEDFVADATCLACGPGLGRSPELTKLVDWMYGSLVQPMVIDADGLNALAARHKGLVKPGGPRILTPHPGEFRRLIDQPHLPREACEDRAVTLAAEFRVVVVLKGHRTLVTDGTRRWRNSTGNPGMATGGSGDVLTGLVLALVCQGLGPFEAAQLGVHLHGLAGDLAAAELGQVSLIASDLIRFLPPAFKQIF